MVSFDAQEYWEGRYASGKTSGAGSRGLVAKQRADFINEFIQEHDIKSVVDWGVGDGYLLELLSLKNDQYLGVDLSATAIGINMLRFGRYQWLKWNPLRSPYVTVEAEMALSIDVIFHLVSDHDYAAYMEALSASATRFLLVCSPDEEADPEISGEHILWRKWTPYIRTTWEMIEEPSAPWAAYVFKRRA